MKGKKDFAVVSYDLFIAKTADIVKETIDNLKKSAEETGLNKGDTFIGETLLLMMFSAKLAQSFFEEDDDTVNTDNESEVTL